MILIIGSHLRTELWIRAAKQLGPVAVLCKNGDELTIAKRLLDSVDEIIDLTDIQFESDHLNNGCPEADCLDRIKNVFDIIRSDRRLRTLDWYTQKRYLCWIVRRVSSINFSKFSFGLYEATWAHEQIIEQFCQAAKVDLYQLRTDRFFSTRFMIFLGSGYRFPVSNPFNHAAIGDYEEFLSSKTKPTDFHLVEKRNQVTLRKLKSFVFLLKIALRSGGSRFIHRSFFSQIMSKVISILMRSILLRSKMFASFDQLNRIERPKLVVLLHMQPEQSIDVANKIFSDQLRLIEKLRSTLKINEMLVVKEHPHCVGIRPVNFYLKVRGFPNTLLIDPHLDVNDFIEPETAVCSISGTGVAEVAFHGGKSAFLSDNFMVEYVGNLIDLESTAELSVRSINNNVNREGLNCFANRSFDGDVRDPFRSPKVHLAENVEKIRLGLSVVKGLYS